MVNWINKYKINYSNFTETEKIISDYFINNSNIIGKRTLRAIANELNVGQQTIIRTIKAAGYNSWKEFQIEIWKEEGIREKELKENSKEYKGNDIPLKIIQDDIQMIANMAYNLDMKQLYKVVHLLKKANVIDVYGTENSSNAAAELTGKLLHLGFTCRNYSDLFFQKISAGHLGNKDVAIAFSMTGETKAVVESLNSAKKSGAKVIAITGNKDSDLAKEADYIFITPTIHMDDASKWISSRITQIAFVDALCAAILVSDSEKFNEELIKSSEKFENDMII